MQSFTIINALQTFLISQQICNHNHEEADTFIILHVLDVSSINPFAELIINSPDTDKFFTVGILSN